MGFNLEFFFEELLESLAAMPSTDCSEAIGILEEYVKEQRKYAVECGMLPEEGE